jgi:hypothetical protein
MLRRDLLPPALQRELKVHRTSPIQGTINAALGVAGVLAAAVAAALAVIAIPH